MRRTASQNESLALDPKYLRRISAGLEKAYRSTLKATLEEQLQIAHERVIMFSDLHKGARNDADDFRRCERAYNAALAYYFARGHKLVELGDVEELWEERPGAVIQHYARTLELSAQFQRAGRYIRIWGNHDDAWSFQDNVVRYLHPIYGPQLRVHEGYLLHLCDGPHRLGSLFLVHGHQGTVTSDRWSGLARFFVRWTWRPLQRLFNLSISTPARDWQLRELHNIAMFRWVEEKANLVLVAGHTHRPVFRSESRAQQLENNRKAILTRLENQPADEALRTELALTTAELEWTRAQDRVAAGPEGQVPMTRPCYFNTGCCCFVDGDVVGLEIADGRIRLVRWPDDEGRPEPHVLADMPLAQLFAVVPA